MFVLDEADEMLSRGFKDQIYDVFRKMPSNTQVSRALLVCCPVSDCEALPTFDCIYEFMYPFLSPSPPLLSIR